MSGKGLWDLEGSPSNDLKLQQLGLAGTLAPSLNFAPWWWETPFAQTCKQVNSTVGRRPGCFPPCIRALLCANPEVGHCWQPLSPSHSQWFSVLSQVHASTDQEIREMHDEQANPQNAVVSEHPWGGGDAPREAGELGISGQSLFLKENSIVIKD